MVIVTRKDGSPVEWDKLFYNHRNGELYYGHECKTSASEDYSYVVLTIRRGVARTADELARETLDAAIERATANENRLTAMTNVVASSLRDYALSRGAERHFSDIRSSNSEIAKDALSSYMNVLWCSTSLAAAKVSSCTDYKIDNKIVVDGLRKRLLDARIFCAADFQDLANTEVAKLKEIIGAGKVGNVPKECG